MTLFAIVKADGTLRRNRKKGGSLCIYETMGKAKNNARSDGDSVVEVEVDLSREPLFIRRRVVSAK